MCCNWSPHALNPMLCNMRNRHKKKQLHTTTRQSPSTARKTQNTPKQIKDCYFILIFHNISITKNFHFSLIWTVIFKLSSLLFFKYPHKITFISGFDNDRQNNCDQNSVWWFNFDIHKLCILGMSLTSTYLYTTEKMWNKSPTRYSFLGNL